MKGENIKVEILAYKQKSIGLINNTFGTDIQIISHANSCALPVLMRYSLTYDSSFMNEKKTKEHL